MKEGIETAWSAQSMKEFIAIVKDARDEAGQSFAHSFVEGKDAADKAFGEFKRGVVTGYKTVALTLSATGQATYEHLGQLANAIKTQIGEDIGGVIDLINSKMQKMEAEQLDVLPTKDVEELQKELAKLNAEIEEVSKRFKKSEGSWKSWTETLELAANATYQFEQVAINAFNSTAEALTDFVMTGKMQLKSLVNYILRDVVRALIRMQMSAFYTNAIVPIAGGLLGGGAAAPIVPAGTGMPLGSASFAPMPAMAEGGVVRSPTMALIGEGGPEAVLPLAQVGGGLGVKGTAPPQVEINIDNQSKSQVTTTKENVLFDGERLIIDVVVNDYHKGGPIRNLFGSG
jgi:hypothetical protein